MFIKMNQKGFTLIEILVVITLILIIAGIALPRFAGVSAEGKKAKAAGELKTLQTALDAYLVQPGKTVPATWADLETKLEGATPRLIGDVNAFDDPFETTGTKYSYIVNGDYYVLFSTGPGGAPAITAISAAGVISGGPDNDIYVSNGSY